MEEIKNLVPPDEEVKSCDPALKPNYTPAGASPKGFWDCDKKTGEYFWNDPQIAE